MTEKSAPDYATWLPVIGKGLAYLCLAKATEADKTKFKDVLARVDSGLLDVNKNYVMLARFRKKNAGKKPRKKKAS